MRIKTLLLRATLAGCPVGPCRALAPTARESEPAEWWRRFDDPLLCASASSALPILDHA